MTTSAAQIIPLDPTGAKGELIGSSRSIRNVLWSVNQVARTDSTVLIHGETGTGKELVAKAIHERSQRRHGAYVKVNCAAIPAGLLESELFGHERGAFTGALLQTTGRFQLAHQGTLFLDEIGDLPLELQPKLLRVLQEQQIERVGSARAIKVDVRIVAATNQDLEHMVRERRFRADLFYRLNVFPITLPPLRERGDDIELLVRHFVERFACRMGKEIEHIPEEAIEALTGYDWPGNIRELQNVIERAVIMSSGPELRVRATEFARPARNRIPTQVCTLADAERAHILHALRQAGWVIGGPHGAAARLGMPRTSLIHRMQRLGIVRESGGRVNAGGPSSGAEASAGEDVEMTFATAS